MCKESQTKIKRSRDHYKMNIKRSHANSYKKYYIWEDNYFLLIMADIKWTWKEVMQIPINKDLPSRIIKNY